MFDSGKDPRVIRRLLSALIAAGVISVSATGMAQADNTAGLDVTAIADAENDEDAADIPSEKSIKIYKNRKVSTKKKKTDKKKSKKGKAEEKDEGLHGMSLAQLRDYQYFVYFEGGRDPMVFRAPPEKTVVRRRRTQKTTETEVSKTQKLSVDEQRQYLLAKLTEIEIYTLLHNIEAYQAVLNICDEVRVKVLKEWGGAPANAEINMLWKRIVIVYDRTAKRLLQAEQTRDEFEKKNIRITGIRWSPKSSLAIINERAYEPGQMLMEASGVDEQQQAATENPVYIESVEKYSVLFIYKGQKFRKEIIPFSELKK